MHKSSIASAGTPVGGAARPDEPKRLLSLDCYRGWVMLLMLAEVLQFCEVSRALPGSALWGFLCFHQTHAAWVGCSLHDLIQPGFFFLVGASMAFSLARRRAQGTPTPQLVRRALLRALALIVLGMLLTAAHPRRIEWLFTDTLTQIGLAYGFLFVVAMCGQRRRWWVFALILFGCWLAFALYPLPGPDLDYARVGVSPEWLDRHGLKGFAAHWQKNSNLAWAFDCWFLNVFPQHPPFTGSTMGLATLNFVPTIATMILGLVAGDLLKSDSKPARKLRWLASAGVIGISVGWLLNGLGICPVAKPIWTPSWVLMSGGCCFLALACFHWVFDVSARPWTRWVALPLAVVGANSLAAYALSHLYQAFAFNAFRRLTGGGIYRVLGDAYEPLLYGGVVLTFFWVLLFILFRRRIFVRL